MLNALFPSSFTPSAFDQLSREMDRLIGLAPAGASHGSLAGWPGMNLWREGEAIVAEAEVPGMKIEELEVVATAKGLKIRGERKSVAPENATAIRIERPVGRFERSVQLPVAIEPDEVKATLTNGVLRVVMPVARAARPRRIAVSVGGEPAPAAEAAK